MMNIFNTKKTTPSRFQLKALVAAVAMTSTFSSIAEIIPSEQVIKGYYLSSGRRLKRSCQL